MILKFPISHNNEDLVDMAMEALYNDDNATAIIRLREAIKNAKQPSKSIKSELASVYASVGSIFASNKLYIDNLSTGVAEDKYIFGIAKNLSDRMSTAMVKSYIMMTCMNVGKIGVSDKNNKNTMEVLKKVAFLLDMLEDKDEKKIATEYEHIEVQGVEFFDRINTIGAHYLKKMLVASGGEDWDAAIGYGLAIPKNSEYYYTAHTLIADMALTQGDLEQSAASVRIALSAKPAQIVNLTTVYFLKGKGLLDDREVKAVEKAGLARVLKRNSPYITYNFIGDAIKFKKFSFTEEVLAQCTPKAPLYSGYLRVGMLLAYVKGDAEKIQLFRKKYMLLYGGCDKTFEYLLEYALQHGGIDGGNIFSLMQDEVPVKYTEYCLENIKSAENRQEAPLSAQEREWICILMHAEGEIVEAALEKYLPYYIVSCPNDTLDMLSDYLKEEEFGEVTSQRKYLLIKLALSYTEISRQFTYVDDNCIIRIDMKHPSTECGGDPWLFEAYKEAYAKLVTVYSIRPITATLDAVCKDILLKKNPYLSVTPYLTAVIIIDYYIIRKMHLDTTDLHLCNKDLDKEVLQEYLDFYDVDFEI